MNRGVLCIAFSLYLVATPLAFADAATLSSQFNALAAKEKLSLAQQSVCIEGPQGIIVSRNATMRIIPASVSKLYVFDWALATLPTDFRYETNFVVSGKTLYINGGSDPHFVIEHLRDTIQKISAERGIMFTNIVFSPNFYFNWKTTTSEVSLALRLALVEELQKNPSFPLSPSFTVSFAPTPYTGKGTGYQFKSMPIPSLMKQINNYSTNITADTMFQKLGGSAAFSAYMQKEYGIGTDIVRFETGSGLSGNYTTCDVTIDVLQKLESRLKKHGLELTDIMSVPMIDPGVLQKRAIDLSYAPSVVAKSGSINNHQALAGIINTSKGSEYFAVFTNFKNESRSLAVRAMIDKFITAVLKDQRTILKPFNYTPDLTEFLEYRIVKKS